MTERGGDVVTGARLGDGDAALRGSVIYFGDGLHTIGLALDASSSPSLGAVNTVIHNTVHAILVDLLEDLRVDRTSPLGGGSPSRI
jgi:hypothetical protein